MAERPESLIVVGASAGGVEALQTFVHSLPLELEAAVVVVLHLSPTAPSVLPDILRRAGTLPVTRAFDGVPLSPGHIVVASPDHHLCIQDGSVRETLGAKENGHRPAIDVLFRSAAEHYGSATVGVLLSGLLDDGVIGLRRIVDAGGVTAVQSPEEAPYPSMPEAAIRAGVAQHVLPASELGTFVAGLTSALRAPDTPDEEEKVSVRDPLKPGTPEGVVSSLTCPSCGGALWASDHGDTVVFECRTGHSFSSNALVDVQAGALDDALWGAYRSLLEQADLHRRLASRIGESASALRHEAVAEEALRRARVLRHAVLDDDVPD